MENEVEDWEPYKHQFSNINNDQQSQDEDGEVDEEGGGEIEVPPLEGAKRKKSKKKRKSPSQNGPKDFILDGVRVDNQKKLGKYDQLIDVHLIRFFESKEIQRNLKNAGVINKKGTLLDTMRTKEIHKQESELMGRIDEPTLQMLRKDFNLKKKLNQQLNQLANQNLII